MGVFPSKDQDLLLPKVLDKNCPPALYVGNDYSMERNDAILARGRLTNGGGGLDPFSHGSCGGFLFSVGT